MAEDEGKPFRFKEAGKDAFGKSSRDYTGRGASL